MKLKKPVQNLLLKSSLALTILVALAGCKKKQVNVEDSPQDTVKTPVVVTPPPAGSGLITGTNGHPFNAAAYNALLRAHGFKLRIANTC